MADLHKWKSGMCPEWNAMGGWIKMVRFVYKQITLTSQQREMVCTDITTVWIYKLHKFFDVPQGFQLKSVCNHLNNMQPKSSEWTIVIQCCASWGTMLGMIQGVQKKKVDCSKLAGKRISMIRCKISS